MNFYLAYKYTNIDNKEETRQILNNLSEILTSNGHHTFILGRDVKHWKHVSLPRLLPILMKNLREQDVVLAYIDSDANSSGLLFELITARLLGKPVILIIANGAKANIYKHLATQKLVINTKDELQSVIPQKISVNLRTS